MKFEDLETGQIFMTEKQEISREEMISFAQIYDPQSIHLDTLSLENNTYDDIIASGFLTMSVAWGLWVRADIFGDDSYGGVGMEDIKFHAPVLPNDTIYTQGTILKLRPSKSRPELGVVTIFFEIKNQNDITVLSWRDISLIARNSD